MPIGLAFVKTKPKRGAQMKFKVQVFLALVFSLVASYAFADDTLATTVSNLSLGKLITIVGGVVLGLNSFLAGVQILFAKFAKPEPKGLQNITNWILSASKFFASNVDTTVTAQTTVTASK